MSINKNFVIKNGLEVNGDLIVADAVNNKVGINTSVIQYELDVNGGIGASSIYVGDDLILNGRLGIGNSYGTEGSYLISTGVGLTWSSSSSSRLSQSYIATEGQDTFPFTYNPSVGIDVFVNGVRLSPSGYTATNGINVVLNDSCFSGDNVDLIAYSVIGIGAGNTGITGITVLNDGVSIGNDSNITSLNFSGSGITASLSGFGATITVNSNWTETTEGIYTLSNVGIGTTNPTENLTVSGDARVTGILTVGTSSITLDGVNNSISVGSGVTIYGNTGDLYLNGNQVVAIGETGNLNTSGIITASAFYGDGSNLTGVGATSLAELTDVNVATAQTGKVLIYDGEKWIDGPVIGGILGIATTSIIDSTLLILGGGTEGDNNFIDSSITGAGLTAVGTVAYSGIQSHFNQTSIYFDGSSYIDILDNSGVRFDAYEDFTIRFWVYASSYSGYNSILIWNDGSYEGLYIYNGNLNWYEWDAISINNLDLDAWNYIVATRHENTLRFYINGNFDSDFGGLGAFAYDGSPRICANTSGGEIFEGYIGEFEFIRGTALYKENTNIPVPTVGFSSTSFISEFIGGVPYSIKNLDDVSSEATPFSGQALIWNQNLQKYIPGILDEKNNISLGALSGTSTLESDGYNNFIGYSAGKENTTGSYNNFFGRDAGFCNTTGCYNNFFGPSAGYSNTTGYDNNFLGCGAGYYNTTGCYNNFLGCGAGYYNTTGYYNNFFGRNAGYYNTTGNYNNFFGCSAGHSNTTGGYNNFFGRDAGYSNTTGGYNNFFGRDAGYYNTTGGYNNFFGTSAGLCNTTGCYNNFFGRVAGYSNTTGCYNNFFGFSAGHSNTTGCYNNFLGPFAGYSNTSGYNNNFLGCNSGYSNTTGCYNNFFGSYSGCCNTTGAFNTYIGTGAGALNPNGEYNVFLGSYAGYSSNGGCGNVFLNYYAGENNEGNGNNFFGTFAGRYNTTGSYNNFIGENAGCSNTTGSDNNFLGSNSGRNNTTGCYNNFFGRDAGDSNTIGSYNNFLGSYSGRSNTTGCYNNFLGDHTGISTSASNKVVLGSSYNILSPFDSPDTTKDTQLAIGVRTDSNPANYWIVGNENFNIGIGTTNPTEKLTVGGDARVTGIVTASAFYGDGSNLTGISAIGISTISHTTASLAAGSSENFTLAGGKVFNLLSLTSSTPSWVRVFGTSSARSADTRTSPGGTLPAAGTEFYAELVTTSAPQTIVLSPVAIVQGDSGTSYIKVVNTDSVTRTIQLDFKVLTLEA
jgi:hypothetical protein